MRHTIRTASCIAAALALGGCQSFISSLGFGLKDSAKTERRAEIFGGDELEKGKLALKQGNITIAIQQFRLAALNEQYAADAFNGLGIAYAQLGRADLAARYFRTAVELGTDNPKYAANLARFYQSPLGNSHAAVAMRAREAEAILAQAEQAAAAQGLTGVPADANVAANSAVTVMQPHAEVTRTSPRELHIATAQATAQPVPAAEAPVQAVAARGGTAQSRITLVGRANQPQPQAEKPKGPVRIIVSRGGGRWASRPRAASYPVRIALKRDD